jgi:acyl carrier protein
MTKRELKKLLLDSIMEIQSLGGHAASEISDSTRPLSDLEGFDSLNATEVTVFLSEKTGCEVEVDIFYPSLESCRQRDPENALTMDEILEKLNLVVGAQGERSDG